MEGPDALSALREEAEQLKIHLNNLKTLSKHFSIPCLQVQKELRRGVGWDNDNAGMLPYNPNRDRMTDRELAAWAVWQISPPAKTPE
jgi:hypothetical protein